MNRLPTFLAVCLLAGCAGSTRNQPPAAVYDFGLPIERLAEDHRWSSVALEIRAPYWLDSPAIDYRLLYENPLKLRSYATSRWAGAPALLLSQRLRQQLGFAGVTGHLAVRCLLRLEVQEFSQVFITPQSSRAVLQVNANLLDARQRLLAESQVASEQPAPTVDAHGGVIALAAASEDLGRQLAGWLNDLEKRGRLKDCRTPAEESQ